MFDVLSESKECDCEFVLNDSKNIEKNAMEGLFINLTYLELFLTEANVHLI
jgi:hypothetical protein